MHDAVTTFLFTDIEGSTRLWEQEPERMRPALARHDAIVRAAVENNRGRVVKMTGDGLHAAFGDPIDAINATLELQQKLAVAQSEGLELHVRCGLHAGSSEGRDNDFYGTVVNRAARIMGAAHGGQMLLSQAVADLVASRLPMALTLRDLGFVRLRDLASPERLYQLLAPGVRSEFSALRSLEGTPNNLPQAMSSFVGRARDLAGVQRLLEAHRLVTLVGMGGLGKTRLSLHVGAESLEEYRDGVWLVELGPLQEAHRVALEIASTLGVKEEGGRPIEEALARHVKDRAMLVILDNCEHLLDSCAAAARLLLSSGADVRVLATSREPLRIAGECTHVIAGLSVPGPREALVAEAAAQFESVRLFVDRASAASPGFELSADNVTFVAAICNRLDGIPLAIELAAARTRSISVAQIATRLKDRFRLLTVGDPTGLPKQRTLRAMIDWSHDLLPEAERALFRRLAVFAGGGTLEAAESVCAHGLVRSEGVLDLLSRLVEKSLVTFDEPTQRYRMLETVHEYAVERLVASEDAAATGDRHLEYFVAFAEAAKPQLAGPEQRQWLARIDAERENILSAHEWAGRSPEHGPAGLRMVNSVKLYWMNRGLVELGHRVTREALERDGAREPDIARAQGLFNVGQLLYYMGRYADAAGQLGAALAIARTLGDERGIATVLQPMGMAAMGQGDMRTARDCLEEALELAERCGEKRSLAAAINALAQFHRVNGNAESSGPMFERMKHLARDLGDIETEAIGALNHAMVLIDQGEAAEAGRMALVALDLSLTVRSRPATQSVLEVSAALAVLQKDWVRAAQFFGAAEMQTANTGLHRDPADELFLTPKIMQARNALGEDAFSRAEQLGREWPYANAMEEVDRWLRDAPSRQADAGQELTSR